MADKSTRKRSSPPAPTLVLLVRHGKTPTTGDVLPGRAPGLHLADKGVEQAVAAAGRIAEASEARKKPIAAVYASPMERTKETAAPISKALGLRTRSRRGLIECDFGSWTGRKLSELRKLPEWNTVQRNPSAFRFPGGESFPEMQTRMTSAISALVTEHPGDAIVCVSHADTIKAAVAQAVGTPLDLFQRIVIGQCSVSAILYASDGPVVLAVNHTGSLVELVPS